MPIDIEPGHRIWIYVMWPSSSPTNNCPNRKYGHLFSSAIFVSTLAVSCQHAFYFYIAVSIYDFKPAGGFYIYLDSPWEMNIYLWARSRQLEFSFRWLRLCTGFLPMTPRLENEDKIQRQDNMRNFNWIYMTLTIMQRLRTSQPSVNEPLEKNYTRKKGRKKMTTWKRLPDIISPTTPSQFKKKPKPKPDSGNAW